MRPLLLLLIILATNVAAEPGLQFHLPDGPSRSFSLSQLKQRLTVEQIEFHDPHYDKTMAYTGFTLASLLALGFSEALKQSHYSDMTFTALDGYKAIAPLAQLLQAGGYVVFADSKNGSWQPVGRKKANPGPFYLVWINENQGTQNGFPWPWQLASFSLVRFADQYPKVYPSGVANDSAVFQGFKLFKQRCFRCHAMDRQGGKVGPDLNAPQNILAYRDEKIVRAFIRNPSLFRYSQMPTHLDLSEQQLNALLAYLRFQGQR